MTRAVARQALAFVAALAATAATATAAGAATEHAVVVAQSLLAGAPAPDGVPTGVVYPDQTVSVSAREGDWAFVTRADGVAGWLGAAQMRPARTCTPRSIGLPFRGRLTCGWVLPAETDTLATWDFPLAQRPNRRERRYGTDRLVQTVEQVAAAFHRAHPTRRLLVGDLSRPHGGPFGPRYGGVGHASHQNGRDVDVFYPRGDGLEEPARQAWEVDVGLAREVVRRFAYAGTESLFVGCARDYRLVGVRKVRRLCNRHHEDHVHVRLRSVATR